MVYNGRFGVERIVDENPKPHLFEEPAEPSRGELSFSEYVLYSEMRKDVQTNFRAPIGEKFPRQNPTREHYKSIQELFDTLL